MRIKLNIPVIGLPIGAAQSGPPVTGSELASSGSVGQLDELPRNEPQSLTTILFRYLDGNTPVEVLLEDITCTVTSEKNIVRVPMLGRDGDIVEVQSLGNKSIECRSSVGGDLSAQDNDYPLEAFRELVKMLDAKQSLEVQSDFLAVYNIKNVVVVSHNAEQATYANIQPLVISMISDEPFEIKLSRDAVEQG